jgi:hypothetical protein
MFVDGFGGFYSFEQVEAIVGFVLTREPVATLHKIYFAAMVVPSNPKKAMFL